MPRLKYSNKFIENSIKFFSFLMKSLDGIKIKTNDYSVVFN